jgi:GTP-binding protein
MTSFIAIVGRPNVGKSTLFNRLSRSKNALVDDQPGVTRDRLYSTLRWEDHPLTIIDTGGFDESGDEPLLEGVRSQVLKAIEEADRVIFMTDGRDGLMPGDREMADLLRRSKKKLFLAVNKIDGHEQERLLSDFYALGLEKLYPISAAHGYGVASLMEDVVADLPAVELEEREGEGRIRVAILGKPNVGKSSLINRILGFERLLVSELPGTTRDSVDILFTMGEKSYLFIDTAGIRRKARVKEKIEKFSMIKALRNLDRCHIAVIVLDALEGLTDQDVRICGYAFERGRAVILALNKWDLVKGDPEKRKKLGESLDLEMGFVSFAPRLNLSARTGERVNRLLGMIDHVFTQFSRRIATPVVNKALEEIVQKKPPPRAGKVRLKLSYATQTGMRPPAFTVFVNRPDLLHFSYHRYLINQFRERLGLAQTPIELIFKKK